MPHYSEKLSLSGAHKPEETRFVHPCWYGPQLDGLASASEHELMLREQLYLTDIQEIVENRSNWNPAEAVAMLAVGEGLRQSKLHLVKGEVNRAIIDVVTKVAHGMERMSRNIFDTEAAGWASTFLQKKGLTEDQIRHVFYKAAQQIQQGDYAVLG